MPASARAAALGEAFGSAADDAAALHANPASLASQTAPEAAFLHAEHLGLARHEALSYAHPLSWGAVGISGIVLTHDRIERFDNSGAAAGGGFSPSDLAVGLSAAHSVQGWDAGGAMKILRQSLDSDSAQGIAWDLGIRRGFKGWTAGAALANLGPELRFRSASDSLPLSLRLSVAGRPSDGLWLGSDLVLPRDAVPGLRLGAEYVPAGLRGGLVALRAGFRTDRAADLGALSGFSAGLGLRLGERARADFSFSPYGSLGEAYRFGLSWRFARGAGPYPRQ